MSHHQATILLNVESIDMLHQAYQCAEHRGRWPDRSVVVE